MGMTVLFYLLFGVGIAAAVALGKANLTWNERMFRVGTAVLFWPLYLPGLLDRPEPSETVRQKAAELAPEPTDPIAGAIAQVEAELDAALASLDGWAENVLARERDRIAELRSAWRTQAERIRQLDRLLAATRAPARDSHIEPAADSGNNVRYRQSEQARRENLDRLKSVRVRLHDDLLGTLAWVRELVSMIHLAKFTGAPASRADELVSQIATAVEGLSEVTQWKEVAVAEAQSRVPAT
jgi:hypothetical protein